MIDQPNMTIVAFPKLSSQDYEQIQTIRSQCDARGYATLKPHVTLMTVEPSRSEEEVKAILTANLSDQTPFEFTLRAAIWVPPTSLHRSWYVFLVPDEGFSQFCHLHQRMHQNALQGEWQHDYPFIPHVTVGSFDNREACMQLAGQLNERGMTMSGTISSLSMLTSTPGKVEVTHHFFFVRVANYV